MKYLTEFRDPELAHGLLAEVQRTVTKPWSVMEVCGGQTHTIVRQGIDRLLPAGLRLVHGPGCPVCVTPLEVIDQALAIAAHPDVIFTSFGDMLRVPGSTHDLLAAKARGADVRVVYSPLDAVDLARRHRDRQVVFFAVGFETTAPANATAVLAASAQKLENFSLLVSHVLVPPAIEAILEAPGCQVQGFLAAGHVCAVMGYEQYEPLAARHGVPIVVTGFEPLDLLEGILMVVRQLEEGRAEVENQYSRAVTRSGNVAAQRAIEEVFDVGDRTWRGIGTIASSGLRLAPRFAGFDATTRFGVTSVTATEDPACIAGAVLQGRRVPTDCSAYGTTCTPRTPRGAPMVSAEGACAAYFRAGRAPAGPGAAS